MAPGQVVGMHSIPISHSTSTLFYCPTRMISNETKSVLGSCHDGAPVLHTEHQQKEDTLHYLNLRFMGVGFRGYIIKKIVNVHKLSKEQKKLASR